MPGFAPPPTDGCRGHSRGGNIVDFAREVRDAMVVMTTHWRTAVGGSVLDSVTNRVVQDSGDPVLVIRPVGSVHPRARSGVGSASQS